jgi:glycine/D-amino acid oxidase-like deaminating enzyme
MAVALALSRAAVTRGARIRPHTEVIGVETERPRDGRENGVGRDALVSIAVNAAGVWSPAIGRMVGVDVAVWCRAGASSS